MQAILNKEIRQFFSSIAGYVSVVLFLIANALFLFVFPDTSLLNDGYATLDRFFTTAPWILLFLIPAITMRSLAEEARNGTLELLLTRPVSAWEIIGGKYLACIILLVFACIPTVTAWVTVHALAAGPGMVDDGAITGSYIGLLLLGAVFTAIGIWTSSLTSHTVVAFLTAVFTCFIFYTGFDALSGIPAFAGGADYYLQLAGIDFHYASISRGVADLRDILYFLSVIALFLLLTKQSLERYKQ
ncbi:gliding motility-associated ABC transporter permease subunit GldF [Compostibacter hankyongensis]|uniref:Gliding motility-associated ABC transporter permease subunit GldF n=1 Tax=Compostibacter hankyongensis TaxID=1007089 RepID=A0ABP8FUC0_9BACT